MRSNRLTRIVPDNPCDWTTEDFDAVEAVARRQAEREENRD